jgi:hypothetical protein
LHCFWVQRRKPVCENSDGRGVCHKKTRGISPARRLAFTLHPRYNTSTMWQLAKEFLLFLKQEKKWWLIPLVVVLLILGALIAFTGGSVLAPLMYPFF